MPRAEIRLLKNLDEYRQCERLQIDVWGALAVGGELLSVTQKYGGVVIGTLLGGRVVGFIYAFMARYHEHWIHWSHMMAVDVKLRDQGFGLRMKLLHRELALARGIKSICWTFDPLESRNARLNIARLGAVIDAYVPDCYGEFPSRIEKGLPSDRLVANWRVGTARVQKRLTGLGRSLDPSLPCVNETDLVGGFPRNRAIRLQLKDSALLVEIPAETDAMRARNLPLARRWRLEARRVFQHYLAAGYRVDDFFPPQPAGEGRCYYLLRRAVGRRQQ